MPAAAVTWFEIPVHDLARATRFYEATFAVVLEPARIDGHDMALFPDAVGGSGGALAHGESYEPGPGGPRLYFGVDDIHATLAAAVAAGGSVAYPVTEVPGSGWVAEFIDSEGNCIALHAAAGA